MGATAAGSATRGRAMAKYVATPSTASSAALPTTNPRSRCARGRIAAAASSRRMNGLVGRRVRCVS
jgi:hypothetical protein